MNQLFPEKKAGKPRVLVAPLDWGLGHATRCVPVIKALLSQGADVWLAGEGLQKALLKQEFADLPFLQLPGYRVKYATSAFGLTWKMIRQSPKVLSVISEEHKWLRKVINDYQPDAVISDNRYGLYHPEIRSVFITHQLLIKSSAGKWGDKMLQKRNYRYINRFSECWVPDLAGETNLSGELSHSLLMPAVPVKYIGPLSRFSKKEIIEKKGHLLLLLSGPEPQRSKLEEILIRDIGHYNGTATVVRGLPGNKTFIPSTGMLQFYNHLPAEDLNREMQEAEFIISRSGYSTVMDAMALQKKCIFIPTPGQTEQEYLGQYLMSKRIALCISQKNFSLTSALEAARNFQYKIPVVVNGSLLSEAVTGLLRQLPVTDLG